MGKELEVVFIKEEKGRFRLGERKKVAYGFARNFLFPNGYIVEDTPENLTKIQSIDKKATKRDEEIQGEAQEVHGSVHEKEIKFVVKTHDDGKLYGSISVNDIVKSSNEAFGTSLDKVDFRLYQPIKETGTHKVTVNIHPNVETFIYAIVEAEEKKEESRFKRKPRRRDEEEAASDEQAEETAENEVAETEEAPVAEAAEEVSTEEAAEENADA